MPTHPLYPPQVHVTKVDAANKCYFMKILENAELNVPERVAQRGGYDLRGVNCDLWQLASPKITAQAAQPAIWKGKEIVCWTGETPCHADVTPDYLEDAPTQYVCQQFPHFCTGTSYVGCVCVLIWCVCLCVCVDLVCVGVRLHPLLCVCVCVCPQRVAVRR